MSATDWVHGREEVLRRLTTSNAECTVLTGDSGIGKSTVLAATQRLTDRALAPPPVRVLSGPASLQLALADAIAGALQILNEDDRGLSVLQQRIRGTARRVSSVATERLRGQVTDHVLDLVSARYGEATGSTLRALKEAWGGSSEDTLMARISSAGDTEVVRVLIELAHELADLADRPLCLALDDMHQATDDDQRRLADVCSVLTDRVRIRAAYTIVGDSYHDALARLEDAGANVVPLTGLGTDSVRAWLVREGLSENQTKAVMESTQGYAQHVQDAISLLKGGASSIDLSRLDRRGIVNRSTAQAWDRLDAELQHRGALLSCFVEPPSGGRTPKYLGIDAVEWSRTRRELTRAGLFIDRAEGAWFHELRRQSVWDRELDEAARDEIAVKVVKYILAETDVTPGDLLLLGVMLPRARGSMTLDPQVLLVLDASKEEVAVAAALMDLSEDTDENRFVVADAVLMRARERYAPTENLVAALEALQDKNLVVYSANTRAAVVCPFWSRDAALTLAGRAAHQSGHFPVPGTASVVFQALVPALSPFRHAIYSIGSFNTAELSKTATKLQALEADGSHNFGRSKGPNLLLDATYGETSWIAAVAYDNAEDRDRARATILHTRVELMGQELHVKEALVHPLPAVPSRRFVSAAEELFGKSLGNAYSTGSIKGPELPLVSWEREMDQRSAVLHVVRDLCDPDERRAYGLEQPVGLAWHALDTEPGEPQDGISLMVTVVGRSGAWPLQSSPGDGALVPFDLGPFAFLQAGESAGLTRGEQVRRLRHHVGRRNRNPIVDEIGDLTTQAVAYNKAQDRQSLPLDADELAHQLEVALIRRRDDAAAFAEAVPGIALPPRRRSVTLAVVIDTTPSVDAWSQLPRIEWAEVVTDHPQERVRVALLDETPRDARRDFATPPAWLDDFAGLRVQEVLTRGEGPADHLLATWLGYHASELNLFDWYQRRNA